MNPNQDFEPFYLDPVNARELLAKAKAQNLLLQKRRSCRFFADQPVEKVVIENLIQVAASAPSGAHKQPWTFVAVENASLKSKIRQAAEAEEQAFYQERASEAWLKDLAPLGTNWEKPFLEDAPWLIVVFKKSYDVENDVKLKNYYVNESVGIACGFLINAIHQCGLATLTHTPSPMAFLAEILERPSHEKPFLLLPVGFPADDAVVPKLSRKPLNEISVFLS
jgi:nitroreductase